MLIRIATAIGTVIVVMCLAFLGLSMFYGMPTGDYHVGTVPEGNKALVVRVYQDMLYLPDRIVYEGPPDMAWKLYTDLTTPPISFHNALIEDMQ